MAGDGKTDFYAEIGLKLNEAQAKKEAAKGAKIASDAMKKALTKSVEEMGRRQASANISLPKGFSFSSKAYMKEHNIWKKIIEKNKKEETLVENRFKKLFDFQSEYEKKSKEMTLDEKKAYIEKTYWAKKEASSIAKKVRKENSDRKAKEKAENVAQREKERRQKNEELRKEKAYRKDIARIKSLSKWALGTTIAGGYLAQRVMNQSTERAFSFRNVQDIGVDYKTLRKWQAASKVFGNIKEEESAQSLVNLRNYRARMAQFGEASSLHANKLLGIDWSQKDERKLINDISSAILRQNKDIQGVLTEEVFGSQKYLSVLKRFQENPQEVWDVEKNILGGSLTEQQIKDIDELGQSFRFTALQAENFKDQIVAIASTDLKKWIKDVGNSLGELTPNLKSIWSGVKTTAKILGAPVEAIYEAGKFSTGFMTKAVQSDLYNESKWKAQDRFDAEMRRRAQIETAQLPLNKTENTENNKNITVNVGGVTVNKNQDVKETVKQAVFGATSAFEKETTNMFVEMPTLGR